MTLARTLALVLPGLALAWAANACAPARPQGGAVRVAAAASLAELAADVAAAWSERGGALIVIQLGSSSALARQIREGAPVDLFLSADARWVDELPRVRRRRAWLANRLVCVVPRDAPDVELADLVSLALGGPDVPVGRYARATLAALGTPLPPRVVNGADARDVLSKVAEGAAQAAIVYATDAPLDPRVRVVELLPSSAQPPIRYEAAALTPAGDALLAALDSPWVAELARRRGFLGID